MGIERREARWPDGLAQVGGDREQRVANAQRHEMGFQAYHRPAAPLHHDGDHGGRCRQREERQLLDHQARGVRAPGRLQALQRPGVEQEQHEGQRDGEGLREQRERRAREHQQPGAQGRAPRVAGVGEQRRHHHRPTHDVASLGDPGHRFDAQRVHGEERRREGARPEGPRHREQRREEQDDRERVPRHVARVHHPGIDPRRASRRRATTAVQAAPSCRPRHW